MPRVPFEVLIKFSESVRYCAVRTQPGQLKHVIKRVWLHTKLLGWELIVDG